MDQNLDFNVAQLMKESVGATRHATVVAGLYRLVPDLAPQAQSEDPQQPELSGPVRLMRTGDGVLVQGRFQTQVIVPCARCLEPVAVALDVALEEIFSPTLDVVTGQTRVPEEDDRALWIDEHHVLDLREVLRQDVLVAMPLHLLCGAACRGLCPTCGQNLNEGSCNCEPEPDPRWASLAALLNK